MTAPTDPEDRFWAVAEAVLARSDVARSTMMGLPCLRRSERVFASYDRWSGDLVVKLPADRVDGLIGTEAARPFAPAGRRFREWAAVTVDHIDAWGALLDEAHSFAGDVTPRGGR